ncbi:MAG: VWA domain-containing protein [Candidatus Kapabacteria bacterium]|nr:VWA domain-containing protein [Candidatus Kapabacteria bacterium]
MKHCKELRLILAFFVIIAFIPSFLHAQSWKSNNPVQNENTMSPRFFITKGNVNNFPLALTDIHVSIVGMIADVTIRQIYVNNDKDPIEAIYVFPASTKAAVYAMKMQVEDRVITAIVKEKQQARIDYTKAKEEGKSASLLEEITPNVFKMNVANILKGDSITVTISYTEMLVPENNIYQFSYPAVVGPRYIAAGTNNDLVQVLNEQTNSRIMPGKLKFTSILSTGVPLRTLRSPSHAMDIITKDVKTGKIVPLGKNNSLTTVKLSDKDEQSGARDIVIEYSLTGPSIESGLLLYEGKEENYFMLMVQPPSDIIVKNLMPREYVFIVDVSGSMQGFPLETTKSMIEDLLETMRPIDKINVMMFSGGQSVLSPTSLPATDDNKKKAINFLNTGFGGGGTELLPALRSAFSMEVDEKLSRTFIVLTDGYVAVEREAFQLIATQLNKANVYSFGIGSSVNRWLIEGMARAGKGSPFIVMNKSETDDAAEKFISYIQAPVLSHITVDYGDFNVYDLDLPSIPDVTGKRPIIVYGKWKGKKNGTITVKGDAAGGALTFTHSIEAAPSLPEHSALRYLWAKNKITLLEDEKNAPAITGATIDYKKEITDLGLRYNMLTKYTSFIAIDENIRVKNSRTDTILHREILGNNQNDKSLEGDRALSSVIGTIREKIGSNNEKIQTSSQSSSWLRSSGDTEGVSQNADALYPGKRAPSIYWGLTFLLNSAWMTQETFLHNSSIISLPNSAFETGFSAGIEMEYRLGDPTFGKGGLNFSLLYNKENMMNSGNDSLLLINGIGYGTFTSRTTLQSLQLAMYYRYDVYKRINIFGGLTSGFILGSSRDISVTAPDSLLYLRDNTMLMAASGATISSGTVPDLKSWQAGVMMGLGYEMFILRFSLTPQIQFHYNLTQIRNNERALSVRFGVALRFVL